MSKKLFQNNEPIAIIGMACTFQEDPVLNVNVYIDDLQLRLNGLIYKAAGKIIAMRKENNIYIMMFDYTGYTLLKKHIQFFVFDCLKKPFAVN